MIGGGAQALSPESALLHADGVVESLGFFLQQHVPLGAGLLHLAHAAEQQQRRRVKHVHQTHAQVQLHEAQVVHDLPRDYRSQSVGERVRDVRDGKDAAVDGHVTHVHQEGQRGQQRRVHQRDAKADSAQREHQLPGGLAGRHRAGAGPDDHHPERAVEPLQLRVLGGQPDGDVNPEHVREEGGQPDQTHLPLRGVHRALHPAGDGGLQERQRDVADG